MKTAYLFPGQGSQIPGMLDRFDRPEERAMIGTSTRRRVGRETRWLVETGATTAVNGPGSLRTERTADEPPDQ